MLMFQEETNKKETEAQAASNLNYGQYLAKDFTQGFKEALNTWNPLAVLAQPIKYLGEATETILSAKNVFGRLEELDKDQARLRLSLGLGSQKADEFRKLVADGAGSFTLMGEGIDKVGETYLDLVNVFKTDVSTTADNLAELRATEKVTGIEVSNLASSFRSVGVSINEVGENMMTVTKVARQAGVSVGEVAKNVTSNIEKMNIYNFEGGVKGLAKMSAQAAKLGINMTEIFKVVDKVFDPQGAIELAASMQRLGVSTSALLDPLRLMDLSQNDPTELQNQIVNMSKDFVRFNKELGQFEIMPGEKRRLNEIGTSLGLASGELQKMAINAANLDMKMKQIRFPSSIASKEDRELIATLAQVNKQGVAEIKVARLDEQGNKTGEYDMVEASQLTTEQLENIKKDQELRGKTMEEIAFDQLDEQKKLNQNFQAILQAVGYGASTSKPITSIYDTAITESRKQLFGDKPTGTKGLLPNTLTDTKRYRESIDSITDIDNLKTNFKEFMKSIGIDINDVETKMSSLTKMLKNSFDGGYDYLMDKAKEYGIGGSETDPYSNFNKMDSETNTNLNKIDQKISSQNLTQNMSKIEFTPLDINEKINVDINVKLDPSVQNQALSEIIQTEVSKWFEANNSNSNIGVVKTRLEQIKKRYNLTGESLTDMT